MNQTSAVQPPKLRAQFPKKAKPLLLTPSMYKVLHGGRGGSKSWDCVRAALILGARRKLFVLCTREVQQSIDESVYKLICDQIEVMGLSHVYEAYDNEIRGANGTRFVFAGLKNQFNKIKSYEGIDLCIVFEATHISYNAWEALLPTIRRDAPYGPHGKGSEVWVEFNPELATDETYKRWVLEPPDDTIVIEINYWDNPWFPDVLRKQMEAAKKKDKDNYLTVWCGKTRKSLKGAIFAKELEAALTDDPCRISPHIKYDKSKPVTVSFDLGRADTMSLWFFQQFGMDHAAILYYGNTGFEFAHYLDFINATKFRIAKLILPADGKAKVVQARFSCLQQARNEFGVERVPKCLPNIPPMVHIQATRQLFPRLYFAEKPTSEGVLGLQHYQYKVNENGQRSNEPWHNWASHPASSLGHYALSLQAGIYEKDDDDFIDDAEIYNDRYETVRDQPTGWMR